MIATDGPRLAVAGAMLAVAAALEFVPIYGRLSGAMLLALLAGLPFLALVANGAGALLQWLDPDPRWRTERIVVHVAPLVALLWTLALPLASDAIPGFAVIAAIAIWALAVAVARWVQGSHKRAFPLIFPLLCLALALDGAPSAMVGLAGASLGVAAIMFRRATIPV